MKHKTLHHSPHYIAFKNDRNKALEKLLLVSKQKINDETRGVFTNILQLVSNFYPAIIKYNDPRIIESQLFNEFHKLLETLVLETLNLRKKVYILTYESEAEIIGQVTHKRINLKAKAQDILKVLKLPAPNGGTLAQRYSYTLTKLKNKILDAIHLSLMQGETQNEMVNRVYHAFPKPKKFGVRVNFKRQVKIKEANDPIEFGFVEEDIWNQIVNDYTKEFIPRYRGPEVAFPAIEGYPKYVTQDEQELTFGWQIEQQMTHDFVTLARAGAFDSGKDNGISDFMWIAILDDKTCEDCCGAFGCVDFDGKTLTEVSEMTNGEVTSSPGHWHCRCDIAPIVGDLPEVVSNERDFESWLNS